MAGLIPEKRTDRNGRTVTRHVRAQPKAAKGAGRLPSPSLQPTADRPGYTPRPKQLERGHFSLFLPLDSVPSEVLWDSPDEGLGVRRHHHAYYADDVNTVEVYDVISAVARPADAMKLLSRGVRTAEQARAFLAERGAGHLAADRSAAAQRALEASLNPHDYMRWFDGFDREGRRDEDIVDAVRLAATSLWEDKAFSLTADAIADGQIAFEDIKTVGITKLKSFGRLRALYNAFTAVHASEGDEFTAADLKAILTRADEEKLDESRNRYLGRLVAAAGTKRVAEEPSLSAVVEPFVTFCSAIGRPFPWTDEEAADMALYHASLGDAVTIKDSKLWLVSTQFYAAGIPADLAREVILSGGTVATAQGIREQGVNRAVADGWL